MTVLGQPLGLLYDALGHVQQADVGLGVRLAPAGDFFFVRRKYSKLLKMNSRNKLIYITIGDLYHKNRHKAQRKAKFYINKCRSASCMQGGLKQASA